MWLNALGLGDYAPAFVQNNVQGDVIFLLLECESRARSCCRAAAALACAATRPTVTTCSPGAYLHARRSHLQDMGMSKIGDRLYFMEVLTQLHDATNRAPPLAHRPPLRSGGGTATRAFAGRSPTTAARLPVLTRLCSDALVIGCAGLSKTMGQLASTRTLPNLQRSGLPLEVVSWSVKEVGGTAAQCRNRAM